MRFGTKYLNWAPESESGIQQTQTAEAQPGGSAADTQAAAGGDDTVAGGKTDDTVLTSKNDFVPFDPKALKLPEDVTLSEESVKEFEPVAKELNLSQEAGQKLFDLHAKVVKTVAEQAMNTWLETRQGWVGEVQSDKEIGGANLPAVKTAISKAFDAFGDPKVKEALNVTGAGDHPAIIRTLYRMAKALTEGGHVAGSPPAQGKPPKGSPNALYPNLNP